MKKQLLSVLFLFFSLINIINATEKDSIITKNNNPKNFITPPVNDECSGAIEIPVNPTLEVVSFVSGTTEGTIPTQISLPQTCNEDENYLNSNDVWFSFTATATKHIINFDSITEEQAGSLYYNVFSGSNCGDLNILFCHYAANTSDSVIQNLIIGANYKIRVRFPESENSITHNFDISITTPPLPVNDECNGAISVTVNPTLEIASFVSGTNIGATHSTVSGGCSYQNALDVWFSFVATSSKQLIYFSNIVSNQPYHYLQFQMFSGTDCTALTPVICLSGEGHVVDDLIVGQTYKINVYSLSYYELSFDLSIHPVESVINDECISATDIPVNEGVSTELFTTAYDLGSTVSEVVFGCDSYMSQDTWYSFVATNTVQIVRFYDLNDNQIYKTFSLYSGEDCSSLSMINCSSAGLLKNLIIGTTYKIRLNKATIDSPFNEAFRIRINTIGQLLNDECQNATTLTVNPNLEKNFFVSGSTVLASPSISSQNNSNDVWYSFVATSPQHLVYIDNIVGYFSFYVFPENNCEVPEVSNSYGQPGTYLNGLIVGSAYTIRLVSGSDYPAVFDLSIMTPEIVVNDECSNAIDVPVNESLNCELFVTGITQGATPSEFDGYSSQNDTWYSFVATSKTHSIKIDDLDNVITNLSYVLYSTSNCNDVVEIGYGGSNESLHNNLIVGTTYKIRLNTQNEIAPFSGNVKICITTPLQPINDECSNAIVVPVNPSLEPELFVSSTTFAATNSIQPNNCLGNADDDVWFSFTATSKFHYIKLHNIVGASQDVGVTIYEGNDCEAMLEKKCMAYDFFGLISGINTLTIGQTYKIRVYSKSIEPNYHVNFDISITTPILAANDECFNSIAIPVSTPSNLNYIEGSLEGASQSNEENTCTPNADDDVWYDFVATSTSHSIKFATNYSGSPTFFQFAVYSGDCNDLIQLSCSAANLSVVDNLVIGQSYKVRVWSASPNPQYNVFNVIVLTTGPPIVASTTQYTPQELVTNVLVNNPCVSVSNITSSTGSDFVNVNGIGYFTSMNPNFPINSGIVLSTGNAANVAGPNTTTLSEGNGGGWYTASDNDLQAIILASTGTPMVSRNTTKLEFDFTSQNEFMSFNFLFASEEYSTFQCVFADAFAFLLTDLTTGQTTNLAVVPGTTNPISVVTIRDNQYNSGCASQNPSFFDSYFGDNFNQSISSVSPTNFNGQTALMSASSAILPNHPYHIKLVIADRYDGAYDSAVFIQAGSFSSGPPQCTDKIQLVAFIDENNNGTKEDTESSFAYGSFVYQVNNAGDINNISSPIGNYTIYDSNPVNSYDFSYQVHPEYAGYFSSGTITHNDISIAVGSGTQTLYFPIIQIQGYNDVTVSIVPVGQPTAGFSYTNKIVYKNLGTAPASGTITYTKDPSVTVTSTEIGVVSTTDGFTYNFSNLSPYETRSFDVLINVPGIPVVNIDDVLESSVGISAPADDINLANNLFSNSQIVVASYDPNDKMEAHGDKIAINQFSDEDYLYYTIRFQNTGTANAINIRIEDLLDAQLDEESIRMVSASHGYVMERVGNQIVWKFDYIYLPSYLQNEALSQGYVTFKIKLNLGFEVGDIIPNTAEIYFDTNPAIITNTFTSTFEEQLATPEFASGNLLIYPNPSKGLVNVSILNATESLESISLYDVLGKKIISKLGISAAQATFDVSLLSKGVYLIEIITENNIRITKKLVVN